MVDEIYISQHFFVNKIESDQISFSIGVMEWLLNLFEMNLSLNSL